MVALAVCSVLQRRDHGHKHNDNNNIIYTFREQYNRQYYYYNIILIYYYILTHTIRACWRIVRVRRVRLSNILLCLRSTLCPWTLGRTYTRTNRLWKRTPLRSCTAPKHNGPPTRNWVLRHTKNRHTRLVKYNYILNIKGHDLSLHRLYCTGLLFGVWNAQLYPNV